MQANTRTTRDILVGRDKEKQIFREMLTDKRPEWIFHLWGRGGIGKTRLLEWMSEETQRQDPAELGVQRVLVTADFVDFYKTANHTVFGLLGDIARQLGSEHFERFNEALADFRALVLREPELPHRHEAAERVWRQFFDDYQLLTQNSKVVLLLDTFEEASIVEDWIVSKMLPNVRHNTVVVISGRKETAFPSADSDDVIIRELESLSEKEVIDFFRQAGLKEAQVPDELVREIAWLSEGCPIYIALAVDWILHGEGRPNELVKSEPGDKFGRALVRRVLRLRRPEDQAIMYMAVVWRRMDRDLMAHLLKITPEEAEELIERLSRFSFIKYRKPTPSFPGSCLLHDEMRDLLAEYAWPEFAQSDKVKEGLIRDALSYYKQRITEAEGPEVFGGQRPPQEREIAYLLAEWLFYKMSVGLEKGFQVSERLFRTAVHYLDLAYCDLLNEEVGRFRDRLTPEMHDELRFREALVLSRRERFMEAMDIWEKLLISPDYDRKMRATTLMLLVETAIYGGKVDIALKYGEEGSQVYEELLQEQPERANLKLELGQLYNNLGLAHRTRGELGKAIEWYQKALEAEITEKGKARTLNNLGYVYKLQGRLDKAKTYCGIALKIRERLGIPYEFGLGYNTMGMVLEEAGNIKNAADLYHKALAAFEEAGSQRGKGLTLINIGRLQRNINDFDDALIHLEEAQRIFERQGDIEHIAEVLNEIGCAYRGRFEEGDAEKAEEYLHRSLEMARSYEGSYREADNLEDLTVLYFRLGDLEKTKEYIKKAKEIIEDKGYDYLRGKVLRMEADVLYEEGQYEAAFRGYLEACAELARMVYVYEPWREAKAGYVVVRYEEMRDRLQEQLHKRSPEEIKEFGAKLIRWWEDEGLAEEFPEFIGICEDSIEAARFLEKG